MVRAADSYVRVIVRRPHAYFLIDELFEGRGGIRGSTPAGCLLADGTTAPLPGIYVLDADGRVEGRSAVVREALLQLLQPLD